MTPPDPRDPGPDDQDDFDATVKNAVDHHLREHHSPDGAEDDDEIEDGPAIRRGKPWRLGSGVGILLIVIIAATRAWVKSEPQPDVGATSPWDTLYARQEVKVRAQAGADFQPVRVLNPGEAVKVYHRDSSGWVQVYELDGHPIGFAYRTHTSFDTIPPAAQPRGVFSSALPPPAPSSAPAPRASRSDTTAICNDYATVFNRIGSGTCQGHGGVMCWINHPGPNPPTTARFCTLEDRRKLRDATAVRR